MNDDFEFGTGFQKDLGLILTKFIMNKDGFLERCDENLLGFTVRETCTDDNRYLIDVVLKVGLSIEQCREGVDNAAAYEVSLSREQLSYLIKEIDDLRANADEFFARYDELEDDSF